VTTKLWNNKHHPDDVEQALQDSLNDLGLDYVDLYLMHWPVAFKRGDEMFPKQNGKPATENIDYVDVWVSTTLSREDNCGGIKMLTASNRPIKLWRSC
jgi:alcohol dehydrogenase (NADP+)